MRSLDKWLLAVVAILPALAAYAATTANPDRPTKFTNQGSISNTRHNLTQRTIGAGSVNMDTSRNDYGEVCVYCHTPHGASDVSDSSGLRLPLWNRTIQNPTGYTTYDQLNTTTLTQTVSQPGANSLACLSCHDAQTAVDSIINMPGSGRYQASQATSQNNAFLDSWPGGGDGAGTVPSHATINGTGCMVCHVAGGTGAVFPGATDFTLFYIGTDLRNDHPVGVTYPTANSDFTTGLKTQGVAKYIDTDGNNKMDKGNLRIYNGKVECASCHDPHGVPSAGAGSAFNPTFLRVSNANSGVCLTCHVK